MRLVRLTPLVATLSCLLAGPAPASDRPDFSGHWVLSTTRSSLARGGITGGSLRINHAEPRFRLARVFQTGDGPDYVSYELTTDDIARTSTSDGAKRRSRLRWEGNELVLDETIEMGGRTATNVVRYSLADGGATLTARESFRGPRLTYDNVWVFERR